MKFLTAYQLLESTGMFKIERVEPINEALDEKTITATVYIRKEVTKSADMRTKEGRRIYHMNAKAFGIHESREDQIREAIDVVKKHGYRVMNEERYFWRDDKGRRQSNATQIGSQTVGMFHKDSIQVKHSWTWIDVNAIQEAVKKYGITVTEQHQQAQVTHDWDEEPVPGTPGVDGPYGEGSSSIMYFSTTTERKWLIKFTGSSEAFEAAGVKAEDDYEKLDELIKKNIPAYAELGGSDDYEVKIDFK